MIYEFGLGDEMLYPIVRAAPPSALFWRLDLGPLDEAARKDFLDRVEGELRLIDEKWSGWAAAPVKRIHTFVSKEASGNGFVNKPVAAFAPYPSSILSMSERVRCSLYSLINSYSAMSGRTAAAGGDPLSAEGEPFERLALVPLTVVPAILSAVRRLNERRVEALNREIRAFDESEDSEALRELVRVYLGIEPPERVEYPKVRVLFASPAAISRAFYEDMGREIIAETGSLPGGDVSAMLDEIAAEGEAIAQSVRMDVHAKLAGLSRFLAGAARYGMRAGTPTPVLAGKAAARRLIRLLPAARACGLGGVAEYLAMVGEKMGEGRWRDAEAAALKAAAALDLEPGGGDAGEALSRVASELARRAHSLSSPSSQSALKKGHERRGGGGQTRSSALMDRR